MIALETANSYREANAVRVFLNEIGKTAYFQEFELIIL